MKSLLALFLPLTISVCVAQAPYQQKMDFHLRAYLAQEREPGAMVDLFIHGDEEAVAEAVKANGGFVKKSMVRLVSARVPADKVSDLAQAAAVHHFEFSLDAGQLMNDSMRLKARVNDVQMGLAPLPQGYDGEDVVMGYIDSGLDVTHPDLRTADNLNRLLKFWDQVPPANGQSPAPYGYGTVYTKAQLDAGGVLPDEPAGLYGHGTTVVGTGSGNGLANGRHKGVAPASDIIVVATNFALPNWRSSVADAVDYIVREAEAIGKPVVINASLGSYFGSHDGKDAAALFIEELLNEQGGRVMVSAAGNSNQQYPYHMHTDVDADTSFTWFTITQNSVVGGPAVFFELWADAADFDEVQFAMGYDRQAPTWAFRGNTPFRTVDQIIGQNVIDTLYSYSGNRMGVVQYYAAQRGEQIQMQVYMDDPDSSGHFFRFMTTGNGDFDVWSSVQYGTSNMSLVQPTPEQVPDIANYVMPDRNQHMVDSWACLSNVITVANYNNEVSYVNYVGNVETVPGVEDDIALNSSAGPTRDGRLKPDIAAPGDICMTAAPVLAIQGLINDFNGYKVDPGGMHIRQGGTSIASPVVAGTAALFLQRCPNATAQEVKRAILDNARSDAFTGTVPNNRWGMGKLDAFNTVLNKADLLTDANVFCDGEVMEVRIPEPFSSVEWNDGSTQAPLDVTTAGPVYGILTSPAGCVGLSDTLTFEVLGSPETPIVQAVGNELTSSVGPSYQWFLDGQVIEGATYQTLEAEVSGSYYVEFEGANGCRSQSEPIALIVTSLQEAQGSTFGIWPNPAKDQLNLVLPKGTGGRLVLSIVAADGKVVRRTGLKASDRIELDIVDLSAGTYLVEIENGDERYTERFVKLP